MYDGHKNSQLKMNLLEHNKCLVAFMSSCSFKRKQILYNISYYIQHPILFFKKHQKIKKSIFSTQILCLYLNLLVGLNHLTPRQFNFKSYLPCSSLIPINLFYLFDVLKFMLHCHISDNKIFWLTFTQKKRSQTSVKMSAIIHD